MAVPFRTKAVRTLGPAAGILALQLVAFPMPIGMAFSGFILGMLGALAAVGLALVWRSNRVVNFAHGDLGALPATLTVLLVTLGGLPWLAGLGIGLAAALAVGLLANVLVVRRFHRAPRLQLTVATLGLSQILAFGALLLPRAWGAARRSARCPSRSGVVHRRGGPLRRQRPRRASSLLPSPGSCAAALH